LLFGVVPPRKLSLTVLILADSYSFLVPTFTLRTLLQRDPYPHIHLANPLPSPFFFDSFILVCCIPLFRDFFSFFSNSPFTTFFGHTNFAFFPPWPCSNFPPPSAVSLSNARPALLPHPFLNRHSRVLLPDPGVPVSTLVFPASPPSLFFRPRSSLLIH